MKSTTVRNLRYRFPEIEARLRQGETVEIRKRKRVIARLIPVRPKSSEYPDFAARAHRIFGDRVLTADASELVSLGRSE
jgi:antitoxin (DNA-binding transcriptional repressor) of toxin-antitoxin stability system